MVIVYLIMSMLCSPILATITVVDFQALMQQESSKKDYLPSKHTLLNILDTLVKQYCPQPSTASTYRKLIAPPRKQQPVNYNNLQQKEIEHAAFLHGDIEKLNKMTKNTDVSKKLDILHKLNVIDTRIDTLFDGLLKAKDIAIFVEKNQTNAIKLYQDLNDLMIQFINLAGLKLYTLKDNDKLSHNYVTGTNLDKELSLIAIFRGTFKNFFAKTGPEAGFAQGTQLVRLWKELESFNLEDTTQLDDNAKRRIIWLYRMLVLLMPSFDRWKLSALSLEMEKVLKYFNIPLSSMSCPINECPDDYYALYTSLGNQLPTIQ